MCYWFSWYLIPAYWCVVDSHVTSSQQINVFIVMWPHSTILICYWFSCDLIPPYWNIVDSHGTSFHHTNVLLILMWPHSSILMCVIDSCVAFFQHTEELFMWPHSSILICYWFSCDLIPAYWGIVDSQVTSF